MSPESRRERVQRVLLRIVAGILFTGLPGALLPGVAFQKLSWLVGHRQYPLTPLVIYVSGNAGYAYTVLGVWVCLPAAGRPLFFTEPMAHCRTGTQKRRDARFH